MSISSNYNHQEIEKKWYSHWMKNDYFSSTPDDREPYSIVIPPPNITGVLHMGHMLNNTIQDILIRRARLLGKNACWVPGTDHASIATEAKVVEKGGITVPSQLFFDIVRKAPNNSEITLKKDKKTDQLYVFFGKSKFSLSTLPVDDFPEMDEENLDVNLELDSKEFSNLIDRCKFCMGVDESRQYLNGIYFHTSGETISTVATDGHRLSKCTSTQLSGQSFEGIIIPKKTVFEISKILEEFDKKIKLGFSKTRLKVILGGIKIVSKLINSSFPDYESVIPKDNDQIMIVDCKSFSETIDRVSTISNEKFRTVKFDISNNTCVVSSFGNDKSIGTESANTNQISIS